MNHTVVLLGVGLGAWVHPGFYGLGAFVGAGLVFAGVNTATWCFATRSGDNAKGGLTGGRPEGEKERPEDQEEAQAEANDQGPEPSLGGAFFNQPQCRARWKTTRAKVVNER